MAPLSRGFCYGSYSWFLCLDCVSNLMLLPYYPLSATAHTFKCSTTQVKKQVSLNTTLTGFGLFPFRSPLLRECVRKNEQFFLFLRVLRCFNSPGCLRTPMNSVHDNPATRDWVSPFGNPRLKGCLPPNRGLSQAAASFIGSPYWGIHHMPLLV